MTRLKRFKAGLFTITLGMVLVGASFVLADDKAVAEGIILPEELNETTAFQGPSGTHFRKWKQFRSQNRSGSKPWRRLTVLVKYAVENGR